MKLGSILHMRCYRKGVATFRVIEIDFDYYVMQNLNDLDEEILVVNREGKCTCIRHLTNPAENQYYAGRLLLVERIKVLQEAAKEIIEGHLQTIERLQSQVKGFEDNFENETGLIYLLKFKV